MRLSTGTRLGAYEVLSALGAGGMGEVYRARDPRLGRDVALKVLPEAVAREPERLARFRREAQVLAALNHPHIAAIYGVEDSDDVRCLVLEFVEGGTLADRLARGPLPKGEALSVATQIAEALEAAHEKGIVHRDLKPANIALTGDGQVKVLDFGLAKALDPSSAPGVPSSLLDSPTLTSPAVATGIGMVLGTAAYMSPEQARGREADKRSDVWAFGCVLFEMLTGKRAFEGEDVSDTLAAVLRAEPDWRAWPPGLPPAVRSLVEGTLKKDRRERIGDVAAALFVLRHESLSSDPTGRRVSSSPGRWLRAALGTAAVAGALALGAAAWRAKPPASTTSMRLAIVVPDGTQLTLQREALAISPDGRRLVYLAVGGAYLRSLSDFESRLIPGTEGAISAVFSPDGESLAFWADSAVKRTGLGGGTPVTVCKTAAAPRGLAWDANEILFVEPGTGVMSVSADGGKPSLLVPEGDSLIHGPRRLPGTNTLLLTVAERSVVGGGRWNSARIVAQALDTGERTTLIEGGTAGRYVPTGHLVYVSGGVLFAAPFDLSTLRVTGGPVPVVEGVLRAGSVVSGAAHYGFADSGSLAFVPGPPSGSSQELTLFDRARKMQALKLPPGSYRYPRVSPDGSRLAFETNDGREAFIAIYDLSETSSARRLTFGGNNHFPTWSSDGRHVAFQSDREGDLAVFWQPADGGPAERLTRPEPGQAHLPEAWQPSGDTLLFDVIKGVEASLWMISVPDGKVSPFGDVRSSYVPTNSTFSPDGRWVAYQFGESDYSEAITFVQPFPPNGTRYQIGRGGRPLWSRDGTELFYVPSVGRFGAVAVRTTPTFSFSNPVEIPRAFGAAEPSSPRPYDTLPDGRFVGVAVGGQAATGLAGQIEIRVVLNWFDELRARVPVK